MKAGFNHWRSWQLYKWALPHYVYLWKRGRRLRLYLVRMVSIRFLIPSGEKADIKEIMRVLSLFKPFRSPLQLERVGSKHDGGYLVPKDLSGIKALFSPGVGENIEFDLEIASRGIPVYLADNSVDLDVSRLPLVHFRKKHLAATDSSDTISLSSWMEQEGFETNSKDDFMLQMDIEGAEWDIVKNLDQRTLNRFLVVIVEVHELQKVFTKVGLEVVSSFIDRLTRTHKIVNAHINNGDLVVTKAGISVPPLVELVFLRDDCFSNMEVEVQIPSPLESPNDPSFRHNPSAFWGNQMAAKGRGRILARMASIIYPRS